MKMVSISRQARIDLDNIVIGLLRWKKVKLTVNEAMQYVDDIADICYHLGNVNYYFKATYNDHKQFGSYICSYKRNNNTTWFIIYDIEDNDIFVNKIISNYQTIS